MGSRARATGIWRKLLLPIGVAGLAFGVVTVVALEGREVVVVRTIAADGSPRRTRTWIADDQDAAYVEVANPEREFLNDIERGSMVELERHGSVQSVQVTVLPQPEGHRLIRRLLRDKYGWADRWVALLADTSRSLAIRLDPAPPR